MATVYLGIGSNVGNKEANFKEAISRLEASGKVEIVAQSAFYQTTPEGGPPQEDYLNGVLKIKTELSPGDCLKLLKRVEKDMGRLPSDRNYPRVIDLDILLYDDLVIGTEDLEIPHPRMHERHFVLKGLVEIAPGFVHPVLKKTVEELWNSSQK
ncbi:MAG: 2-amino-4-hydroxy-6-hydroxymethyldihydropteridine diphosphokinase [Candidatus Omnitrophota bacterium]